MNPISFPVLADPTPYFAPGVFDDLNVQRLRMAYQSSRPFKHAIVPKLFQDDLLQAVKDECLAELNFTEKETDIYKVNQTGDLASLSFLNSEQIALLSSLLTLRDSLYSFKFRTFLRNVTGCGPLSGIKQDMSVTSYKKGCHLLNHDDSIDSRRVSYILYMPLPNYQLWQKEWGGALELYQTTEAADGIPIPASIPTKTIPPSWNQFVLFAIQPGRSYHAVEEVVVGGGGEDGRQRLTISGWFHAAQPGELGYEAMSSDHIPKSLISSREQLTTTRSDLKEYDDHSFPEGDGPPLPDSPLSDQHISFLSQFLNPVYLQPQTIKALASRFEAESSLELHLFLFAPISSRLEYGLRELDKSDELDAAHREGRVPPHSAGTGLNSRWAIKGPPHKRRYCILKPQNIVGRQGVSPLFAPEDGADEIIRRLQDELFPSPAFRAWLASLTGFLPLMYNVEARRFRPGLDYTLATWEEHDVRLDVVLGLTPNNHDRLEASEGGEEANGEERSGWPTGEWGGWECYMPPHGDEEDPAVYRSKTHKPTDELTEANLKRQNQALDNGGEIPMNLSPMHTSDEERRVDGPDGEEGPEDDTLLTVHPGFNRLLLVLRDESVMHFVKYVSAAAPSSRWDVCAEYAIGMVEADDS
ncbi:hypothetical protein JAAARDRAFT_35618 [Jaapia argillacea MUCL 33604]|uniref:Fe2OG dioxygenase domain-containing protein n=1 Tax=Jaapia argillacea MUCL 33604 TaxID=933084 RepID=A0A067Q356_9AGAM|nr:hypothetical protein JAAARDRAFT_35618 [Jaapia argillacea MUCL 33604]